MWNTSVISLLQPLCHFEKELPSPFKHRLEFSVSRCNTEKQSFSTLIGKINRIPNPHSLHFALLQTETLVAIYNIFCQKTNEELSAWNFYGI